MTIEPTTNNFLLIIFGILFGVAAIFAAVFFILRLIFRRESQERISSEKLVLLIKVPKESARKRKKAAEETPENIKEQISAAEVFFSVIGGMKAQKGFKSMILGRSDHMSFEIVLQNGLIYFYIVIPSRWRSFIEQQVQAHYPEAEISEVDDYNIFPARGVVEVNMLKFSREFIFPIKTYKKSENDPMNSLINSLSKISREDSAAIQFVVRSSRPAWHKKSFGVASEVQQGKPIEKVISKHFTPPILKIFSGVLEMMGKVATADSLANHQPPKEDKTIKLSPLEEEMVKGIEEKSSKAGLDVNIRIVVSSANKARAESDLHNIINSFNHYNIYQYGNSLKPLKYYNKNKIIHDFIFRHFSEKNFVLFNTEEMASMYHFPLPSSETPNILWLMARQASAPTNVPTSGLLLGENIYRGAKTPIYIEPDDRRRHCYIIGKSGVGKSVLISNMANQDVKNGDGICVIDPHGDLVADIIKNIPKERAEDVIYFNPSDTERVMGLNLLEYDPQYPEQKTFVINEMINVFDKLYDLKSTGGPIFEQYMRNAMLLIMEDPESGSTLMEISRVLADAEFRRYKLTKCNNQVVKNFWQKEAEKAGGEAALANMVPYITSKLTQFVANDTMRPIIGQQNSAFNLRDIMDNRKILLVDLSKGKIGEMNAYLLGMVMVGKILMAALSRADMDQKDRKDFYLYIDEFQNFTTDSIAIILSEARKYGLNLIIAHQYIGQLVKNNDTKIKDAVFGNVGTILAFQIGIDDAEVLAKQFDPIFSEYDLINIEKYTCYLKLLIDNSVSRAFSMRTAPPLKGDSTITKKIIELSRLKFGRDKKMVEAEITERYKI